MGFFLDIFYVLFIDPTRSIIFPYQSQQKVMLKINGVITTSVWKKTTPRTWETREGNPEAFVPGVAYDCVIIGVWVLAVDAPLIQPEDLLTCGSHLPLSNNPLLSSPVRTDERDG